MRDFGIVIAGAVPYPEGGAPTSRMRSMAHGLSEAGAKVHVIATSRAVGAPEAPRAVGPVQTWYIPEIVRDGAVLLVEQHWRFVTGALAILERLRREHAVQALIVYNQQASIALPLSIAARRLGMRVFQQYAEQQTLDDFRTRARRLHYANQRSTFLLSPSRTHGSIVISHALEALCRQRGAPAVVVVPALTSTEPARTTAAPIRAPRSTFVLTYVGLGGRRDSLDQIVRIAAALQQRDVPVHLQMLGLSDTAQREVHGWTAHAGLREQTSIRGWVAREELESAFQASHAFVFLREDDVSGRSAFPTRLPELMLTGRPVICSRVGDIPLHLSDGRDLLFVEGRDVTGIAERLTGLVRIEGALEALGRAGQRAALREFDYRRWGRSLLAFVRSAANESGAGRLPDAHI